MENKLYMVSFLYIGNDSVDTILHGVELMRSGFHVSTSCDCEIDVSMTFQAFTLDEAKARAFEIVEEQTPSDPIFTCYELIKAFIEEEDEGETPMPTIITSTDKK